MGSNAFNFDVSGIPGKPLAPAKPIDKGGAHAGPYIVPIEAEQGRANTDIKHEDFVIISSLAFGRRLSVGMSLVLMGGGMVRMFENPYIRVVGLGLIGAGIGWIAAAFWQSSLSQQFMDNLGEITRHRITQEIVFPNEHSDSQDEYEVEDETIRPVVKTAKNVNTISKYEFSDSELGYIASICIVGNKASRDSFYKNGPSDLKGHDKKWANFNTSVWRPLYFELRRLGWLDDEKQWTSACYNWLSKNGFADKLPKYQPMKVEA